MFGRKAKDKLMTKQSQDYKPVVKEKRSATYDDAMKLSNYTTIKEFEENENCKITTETFKIMSRRFQQSLLMLSEDIKK